MQKLGFFDVIKIYRKRVPKDFSRDEIRPFWISFALMLRNRYAGYGLFDEGHMVAYALVVVPKGGGSILIDFFAVTSNERGMGYGSWLLRDLCKLFRARGLIIEVADPEKMQDAQRSAQAQRNIEFYVNRKFELTDVKAQLFGLDHRVMIYWWENTEPSAQAARELAGLYALIYPAKMHGREILLRAGRYTM
jgi:GNAT superfamily N-acetyltransferase